MSRSPAGYQLDLFAEARNWKAYLAERIRPYLGDRILEVGAGIGATTRALATSSAELWACLEPDRRLARSLAGAVRAGEIGADARVVTGTIDCIGRRRFDTAVYIDVLEHIERDRAELEKAAAVLRPGGCLIVLSPAHPWLFSALDEALGHVRRYTRSALERLTVPGLELRAIEYLDSAGLLASAANRWLLNRPAPSRWQLLAWDRGLVPTSRALDRVLGHRVGKSVLAVWTRSGESTEGSVDPTGSSDSAPERPRTER